LQTILRRSLQYFPVSFERHFSEFILPLLPRSQPNSLRTVYINTDDRPKDLVDIILFGALIVLKAMKLALNFWDLLSWGKNEEQRKAEVEAKTYKQAIQASGNMAHFVRMSISGPGYQKI